MLRFYVLAFVGVLHISAEKTHLGHHDDGTYQVEESFETEFPGYLNSNTEVQPIVLTARPTMQPVPGVETSADDDLEPIEPIVRQYNGSDVPTPMQTQPMRDCATGSNGCDEATSECKVFVHEDAITPPLAVCMCLEGYSPDPDNVKKCVATSSPTQLPTNMPTKHPCLGGNHCCDSESSVCQEDSSLDPPYFCQCLDGFHDPTGLGNRVWASSGSSSSSSNSSEALGAASLRKLSTQSDAAVLSESGLGQATLTQPKKGKHQHHDLEDAETSAQNASITNHSIINHNHTFPPGIDHGEFENHTFAPGDGLVHHPEFGGWFDDDEGEMMRIQIPHTVLIHCTHTL
jgi:hypothetical protein